MRNKILLALSLLQIGSGIVASSVAPDPQVCYDPITEKIVVKVKGGA